MKTVVIVSADAEWQAVKQILQEVHITATPLGESFEHQGNIFFHGGWGKISAAASTQYIIDQFKPDLLVNLGTCGGFEGRIERGTIILAEKTLVYDILEQMTDGSEEPEFYATKLDLSWLPNVLPYPVLRGPLISGDRDIVVEDIPMLVKKYDAVAADWESGAIAWTARKNNVRLLILRGVSDLVGEGGGEAYGDYNLFVQRTREIMKKLFDQLPRWLAGIEKVQHGYRGY
jgi:adenosylhomocysteine nucleosidase